MKCLQCFHTLAHLQAEVKKEDKIQMDSHIRKEKLYIRIDEMINKAGEAWTKSLKE
jgi:hypothetical protein